MSRPRSRAFAINLPARLETADAQAAIRRVEHGGSGTARRKRLAQRVQEIALDGRALAEADAEADRIAEAAETEGAGG